MMQPIVNAAPLTSPERLIGSAVPTPARHPRPCRKAVNHELNQHGSIATAIAVAVAIAIAAATAIAYLPARQRDEVKLAQKQSLQILSTKPSFSDTPLHLPSGQG
jgi:hypothetical protein